jgi:hypothetical protein
MTNDIGAKKGEELPCAMARVVLSYVISGH